MITAKTITGAAAVVLTAAGESGSCWLNEDSKGASGTVDIRVYHTDGSAPSVETIKALGKRVFRPNGNTDVLSIPSDNASDVYYATCNDLGATATLMVDSI